MCLVLQMLQPSRCIQERNYCKCPCNMVSDVSDFFPFTTVIQLFTTALQSEKIGKDQELKNKSHIPSSNHKVKKHTHTDQ